MSERQLPYVVVLLSEIFPAKLSMFNDIEAYDREAAFLICDALSIDEWLAADGYKLHVRGFP